MRSRLLPILTLAVLAALPAAAHNRASLAPNATHQQSLSGSLDLESSIALPVIVTETADTLPVFTRSQKLASGFFGLRAEPNIQRTLDLGQESRLGDDFMHARYYNPNLGRFLSVDPFLDAKKAIRSPQWWNRYSYVANNPVRFVDPDGRCGEPCLERKLLEEQLAVAEGRMTSEQYQENNEGRAEAALFGSAAYALPVAVRAGWQAAVGYFLGNPGAAQRLADTALSPPGTNALPFGISQKGMKHAMGHLEDFQKLDKTMDQTKMVKMAAGIVKPGNLIDSPAGRKVYEQVVQIGKQAVRVRVVLNEADNLRSIHIRY